MFGTRQYIGRHRVQEEIVHEPIIVNTWVRRISVPVATFMVVVLGFSSAAFASPVTVVSGDTFSELVAKHCGTSNWQDVALPGRDKNLIYAGETIDITCASGTTTATASAPKPQSPASSNGWYNPLSGHTGTSGCNYWEWRRTYNHRGEDWPAPSGTPIRAAAAGTISTHWDGDGAGNYTVIKHSGGVATVYMHQSSFKIRSGWVNGGDVIGYVGSTGRSSGPHLHIEVHPNGVWNGVTNPVSFLRNRGVSVGC